MRPHRIHAACYDLLTAPLETHVLHPLRTTLLGKLGGRVLDIGAGTGINLGQLDAAEHVVAAEPDAAMRRRLTRRAAEAGLHVDVVDTTAESLPFPDGHFDVVVFTLVLCTVTEPDRALAQAQRVLKPSGTLAVLEHVRGAGRLASWQDRVTPLWRKIAAGCHPNRDTQSAVRRAGFEWTSIEELQPMPAWIPISPMLLGTAIKSETI